MPPTYQLGTFYGPAMEGTGCEGKPDFFTYEAYVWDSPGCNSVLHMLSLGRVGFSCRDTDPVTCPHCGDRSVRICCTGNWEPTVLHPGEGRLTEAEHDKAVDCRGKID